MSGAERRALRDAAAAALEASAHFADHRRINAWMVQAVSATDLPVYGMATPDETRNRDYSQDLAEVRCDLVLVIKRAGQDLVEDDLDSDADAAAAAIQDAIRTDYRACDLTRTQCKIDASGERRVGSVEMIFAVVWFEDVTA